MPQTRYHSTSKNRWAQQTLKNIIKTYLYELKKVTYV